MDKDSCGTHYCQGGDMSRSISSLREFANQRSLFLAEGLNKKKPNKFKA